MVRSHSVLAIRRLRVWARQPRLSRSRQSSVGGDADETYAALADWERQAQGGRRSREEERREFGTRGGSRRYAFLCYHL
jgi:hypothetical protein